MNHFTELITSRTTRGETRLLVQTDVSSSLLVLRARDDEYLNLNKVRPRPLESFDDD